MPPDGRWRAFNAEDLEEIRRAEWFGVVGSFVSAKPPVVKGALRPPTATLFAHRKSSPFW
jgi:hypothetical protein